MCTKQKISLILYLSEGLRTHWFAFVVLQRGARFLSDKEVMNLVTSRNILNYKLEAVLETPERGVAIRREMLSPKLPVLSALACLPYKDYDYSKVLAARISLKRVVLFILVCAQCLCTLCSRPVGDGYLL